MTGEERDELVEAIDRVGRDLDRLAFVEPVSVEAAVMLEETVAIKKAWLGRYERRLAVL